jgi:hypothetical protein
VGPRDEQRSSNGAGAHQEVATPYTPINDNARATMHLYAHRRMQQVRACERSDGEFEFVMFQQRHLTTTHRRR